MNEDKIMDKINKNLKIIDSLLMENGFYKYISKIVNIENGVSELYDNLEQIKKENARLKDKMNKVIEYVNHYETIRGYYEYEECGYDEYNYEEDLKEELLELLKEN